MTDGFGSVEQWTAVAAWVTALVAIVASLVGFRQVKEARRLREQQAQPYVVVYMQPSEASPHIVDLVVRNFGSTAAYDVRLTADPPLMRSVQGGGSEEVWLFETLPVLVPNQEWRTMWDFGPSRAESNLPDKYDITTHFRDPNTNSVSALRSVLDWTPFKGRRWVTTYGIHDAAKSLREINNSLKKWQEGTRGLSVFVRSGDAKDERERERFREWQQSQQRGRDAGDSDQEGPSDDAAAATDGE